MVSPEPPHFEFPGKSAVAAAITYTYTCDQ